MSIHESQLRTWDGKKHPSWVPGANALARETCIEAIPSPQAKQLHQSAVSDERAMLFGGEGCGGRGRRVRERICHIEQNFEGEVKQEEKKFLKRHLA